MAPLWKLLLAATYLVVAVESLVVSNEATDSLVAADEKTRRFLAPAYLGPALSLLESRANLEKKDDAKKSTGTSKSKDTKTAKSTGKKTGTTTTKGVGKTTHTKKTAKSTGTKSAPKATSTGGGGKQGSPDLWRADLGTYFDDPCLIKANGYWYTYSTKTCFYPNLPVFKSQTFDKGAKWTLVDTHPFPDHAGGPDVIHLGGQYVMSYGDGSKNIVVRTSTSPEGPWENKATLITRSAGANNDTVEHNVGDASFFNDKGKIYTVYARKVFDKQKNLHTAAQLEIQELEASGTTRAGSDPKILQKARPAKKGQNNPDLNIEAPFLVNKGGWYYLTFSTREYVHPTYNTQYISSRTLEGLSDPNAKWHALLHEGIRADGTTLKGPGSMSVGRDGDGDEIAFHIIGDGPSKCPKKKKSGKSQLGNQELESSETEEKKKKGKKGKKPPLIHRELWLGRVKFDNGKITIA